MDKKIRKAQLKAATKNDSTTSDEAQENRPTSSGSTNDREESPASFNMVKVTGNLPPVKTKKKKNVISDPPSMKNQDCQPCAATEEKAEVVSEKKVEDSLAEVEKYVEESVKNDLSTVEADHQKPSILDWISSSSSSIFSNISLANVLGARSAGKSPDPTVPLHSFSTSSDTVAAAKTSLINTAEGTHTF
ncbi:hypothetical protein GCK32_022220, partial [Trichostrongylus colubriformis]